MPMATTLTNMADVHGGPSLKIWLDGTTQQSLPVAHQNLHKTMQTASFASRLPAGAGAEYGLKPLQTGQRYGNFAVARSLPHVGRSHTAGQHCVPFYHNQQLCHQVCEWFAQWFPWQQKLLLRGITERCSTVQLEALVTILEPVFHRDFAVSLRNSFPAKLLSQSVPRRTVSFTESAKCRLRSERETRRFAAHEAKLAEDLLKRSDATSIQAAAVSFADELANVIITDALKTGGLSRRRANALNDCLDERRPHGINEERIWCLTNALGNLVADVSSGTSNCAAISRLAIDRQLSRLTNHIGNVVRLEDGADIEPCCRQVERASDGTAEASWAERMASFAASLAVEIVREAVATQRQLERERRFAQALGNVPCTSHTGGQPNALAEQRRRLSLFAGNIASNVLDTASWLAVATDGSDWSHGTDAASSRESHSNESPLWNEPPVAASPCPERLIDQMRNRSNEISDSNAEWLNCQSEISQVESAQHECQLPTTYTMSALDHCIPKSDGQQSQHYNSWSSYPVTILAAHANATDSPDLSPLRKLRNTRHGCIPASSTEFRLCRTKSVLPSINVSTRRIKQNEKLKNKAPSAECRHQFDKHMREIWQWLESWEDHERLALLSDIVKLCNPEMLSYMAQCLFRRLQEKININWLSDRLLIAILSYLPEDDINASSQVCRRWRYLCAVDELWMVKCHKMGARKGIKDLTDIVVDFMSDKRGVDWRLAYRELAVITDGANGPKEQPADVRLQSDANPGTNEPTQRVEAGSRLGKGTGALLARASHLLKWPKTAPEDEEEEAERNDDAPSLVGSSPANNKLQTASKASTAASIYSSGQPLSSNGSGRMLIRRARHAISVISEREDVISRAETIMDHTENRVQTKELTQWIRGRGKTKDDEEEVALDVRTNLQQIPDLLGLCSSAYRLHWKYDEKEGEAKSRKQKGRIAGLVHCVKKVMKFDGHMDAVLCVEFDKRRLFTGSIDRTIRVWDIRSGRSIHKLCGHKGGVTCMKNDPTLLYSGSWDMTIMVWDLIHFRRLRVLLGHSNSVSCMQLDKEYLFTGSHDATVRMWNRKTLHTVRTFSDHTSHVNCMAYDGALITTGSSDRTVRITDVHTGECKRIFTKFPAAIHRILVEGGLLLAASHTGQLFFCYCESGEVEAAIQAHPLAINALAFHKGRFYTASSDMKIKEWDLLGMTCIRSLLGHRGKIYDMKLSDQRLVSCSSDGNVRVWDFATPYIAAPSDKLPPDLILPMVVSQADIA